MQEMTMVERVAKSAADEYFGVGWWDSQGGDFQKVWGFVARAAIEAMREPTDAMIAEGNAHDECAPYDIYESMIDAALSE